MQVERKSKKNGNKTTVEAYNRLEADVLEKKLENEELKETTDELEEINEKFKALLV